MKKIMHFILRLLSKAVLSKYQPKIVAITGSVGKTSAKEAIFSVLNEKYRVRQNIKNYNNEIGLPLTILGKNSAGSNLWKWLELFVSVFINLIILKNKHYPEILVLEMGADRPGDISYLTSIAKPNVAVLTKIGLSHIEFFGSQEKILQEKSSIIDRLNVDDFVVLNQDDDLLKGIKNRSKSHVLTFGQAENSDVLLKNIKIVKSAFSIGTSFELKYQDQTVEIFLAKVLGAQHAAAAATAAAVAIAFKLDLKAIKNGLLKYIPAKGRTNLIAGIKNSWLIDDTYNSSPTSSRMAIDILKNIDTAGRKIIVFGDMLELGSATEKEHQAIGQYVHDAGVDYLFLIGERARDVRRGAIAAGMNEDKIFHFPFTIEAGYFLQDRIKEHDVVLIKGSRGMKMEQVVYEVMAKPWEAVELLVGPVK